MNCNTPTDIVFSFEGFRRRDGITDYHADGFGIGPFEGKSVCSFHDDKPNTNSSVVDLVRAYQVKSRSVIAHIHKASQGQTSLANTHPFMREMWDEYWLLAHSSHLIDFLPEQDKYCHVVGSTGSGRTSCFTLSRLRNRLATRPGPEVLSDTIAGLTHETRRYDLFNFAMSNSNCLPAHANILLYHIVCKTPPGEAHLLDDNVIVDSSEVTTPNGKVPVIATLPLTRGETWLQLAVNEPVIFQGGDIVLSSRSNNPVYMSAEEGLEVARAVDVSV